MSKGLLGTICWYLEVNITTMMTNQISWPDSRQINFTSSVWNFWRRVPDVSPGKTSLLARNKKKQEEDGLISQMAARNLARASNDKKLYQNYI